MRVKRGEWIASSKIAVFVLSAFLVVLIWKFASISFQMIQSQSHIYALKNDLASLKKQQQELQGMGQFLQSDYFLEREARLKYGMQKKGEKAVIIMKHPQENRDFYEPINNSNVDSNEQPISNRNQWWKYFFDTAGVKSKS